MVCLKGLYVIIKDDRVKVYGRGKIGKIIM